MEKILSLRSTTDEEHEYDGFMLRESLDKKKLDWRGVLRLLINKNNRKENIRPNNGSKSGGVEVE